MTSAPCAGILKFTFMSDIEGDRVRLRLVMPAGTSVEETRRRLDHVAGEARRRLSSYEEALPAGRSNARGILRVVGQTLRQGGPVQQQGATGSHIGSVVVYLQQPAQRINDSLVFIDFVNRARRGEVQRSADGSFVDPMPVSEALVFAGQRRFRPILLTTLTTFFALMPMLLETSVQARFLVPMAISLGVKVLFATAITLALVPTLYRVGEDIRGELARLRRWFFRQPPPPER